MGVQSPRALLEIRANEWDLKQKSLQDRVGTVSGLGFRCGEGRNRAMVDIGIVRG